MINRLKIVWLCHFVNRDLIDFYKINKGTEFASWVSETLKAFSYDDDVSIHIIAPNVLKNKDHEFILNGVNYHLYKYRSEFIPLKIYNYLALDYRTRFFVIKKRVKKLVETIKPDLIHLHGAENPYYSSAILQFLNEVPVLVTIQGFIKDATLQNKFRIKQRVKLEAQIIHKAKYFGFQANFIKDEVLGINKNAVCFFHNYLRTRPIFSKGNTLIEKYDCVFFARVCLDKGIEDLLECISEIKKKKSNISLLVIGHASGKYLQILLKKCINLGIEQNVNFMGYLPPKELYDMVLQAKVSVLPTYSDIIPGTVVESMYMKIPVVAYKVGGLLDLNINDSVVTLIDKGNIKALADSILNHLNNSNAFEDSIDSAYKKSLEFYDSEIVKNSIKGIYYKILN